MVIRLVNQVVLCIGGNVRNEGSIIEGEVHFLDGCNSVEFSQAQKGVIGYRSYCISFSRFSVE